MNENVEAMERKGPAGIAEVSPGNDNQPAPVAMGRSAFPDDAVASICRPTRSVTTSGKARTKGWRLTFDRRTAPFVEPLMGWTGGDDTLPQVELVFPTLTSAIRYAQRQGLRYTVQSGTDPAARERRLARSTHEFIGATLQKLGLNDLQEAYGRAADGAAAGRNRPPHRETWASPMDVVRDRMLPLEAKRSILINWAWTEYLIDQAINEEMPRNNRPARLVEVQDALLALEREVADHLAAVDVPKAA